MQSDGCRGDEERYWGALPCSAGEAGSRSAGTHHQARNIRRTWVDKGQAGEGTDKVRHQGQVWAPARSHSHHQGGPSWAAGGGDCNCSWKGVLLARRGGWRGRSQAAAPRIGHSGREAVGGRHGRRRRRQQPCTGRRGAKQRHWGCSCVFRHRGQVQLQLWGRAAAAGQQRRHLHQARHPVGRRRPRPGWRQGKARQCCRRGCPCRCRATAATPATSHSRRNGCGIGLPHRGRLCCVLLLLWWHLWRRWQRLCSSCLLSPSLCRRLLCIIIVLHVRPTQDSRRAGRCGGLLPLHRRRPWRLGGCRTDGCCRCDCCCWIAAALWRWCRGGYICHRHRLRLCIRVLGGGRLLVCLCCRRRQGRLLPAEPGGCAVRAEHARITLPSQVAAAGGAAAAGAGLAEDDCRGAGHMQTAVRACVGLSSNTT